MRLHHRMIREGFWSDFEWQRTLPVGGRLFYAGLWAIADDSGCLYDDPMVWKCYLFPADSQITHRQLVEWRDVLKSTGKLIPYTAEGRQCLYIANFHAHQSLRHAACPDVPLPSWVRWIPSESKHRSGVYEVNAGLICTDNCTDDCTDDCESSHCLYTSSSTSGYSGEREPKSINKPRAYGSHVRLTEQQSQSLYAQFGEVLVSETIDQVNDYCAAHGKSYKDYAAAIRQFIRSDIKRRGAGGNNGHKQSERHYDTADDIEREERERMEMMNNG